MSQAKSLKAALRGFEFGVATAFLFHQVVLHATGAFGGGEDIFPVSRAFSEVLCIPSRDRVTSLCSATSEYDQDWP